MADIRPFRGVHYSTSLVKDLSTAICPPHDIISPQRQQGLYQASEYNFVRLEFGRESPRDTVTDNKYTRAAATLENWLEEGVLETDPAPAFYVHDHLFTLDGKEYTRRSMIARVRLEEWEKLIVRPHEATMAVTRTDRLSLLWALQANTSPILAMFENRQISSLIADQSRNKPLLSTDRLEGESHKVWAITDHSVISRISARLAQQPLYVADGHHRYESALAYRNERRTASTPSDASFNFVMMALVDFTDPGLKILATHRLVSGISVLGLHNLDGKLSEFFELEKTPLHAGRFRKQFEDFLAQPDGVRVVVLGPDVGSLLGLKLKDPEAAGRLIPGAHSDLYKKLDVSIIDHVILEKLLGMTGGTEKPGLAYSHDVEDSVNRVRSGEFQLAVLTRPVRPDTLKAVSDAGDRMPPKATYFYPKAPAGLIFNRLVD